MTNDDWVVSSGISVLDTKLNYDKNKIIHSGLHLNKTPYEKASQKTYYAESDLPIPTALKILDTSGSKCT